MDKSSNAKLEWSNELILEFIQLYEQHTVLWDPNNEDHKNRNRLLDAWQNIAKEMSVDITVETLRKKKESLMATYRTLARKVRESNTTRSGANDAYTPCWFAYDAIDRFIRVTTKKIPSFSSEKTHNEESSEDEIPEKDVINDKENVKHNNETFVHESRDDRKFIKKRKLTNFVFPLSTLQKRERVRPCKFESEATRHLKLTSDVLTSLVPRSKTRQSEELQDSSEFYTQLLIDKLRSLSRRTQLILQNEIDNLVFDAELNEIDNSTDASDNYYYPVHIASPTNSKDFID